MANYDIAPDGRRFVMIEEPCPLNDRSDTGLRPV